MSITSCPLISFGVEDSRGNIAGKSLVKFKSLSQRAFSVMCTEPATPSLESNSFLSPSLLMAVVGGDDMELLWRGMRIKRGEGLENWRETSAHASLKNHKSTAAKKTRLRKKKARGTYDIFKSSSSDVRNAMTMRETGKTPLMVRASRKTTTEPNFLIFDSSRGLATWRKYSLSFSANTRLPSTSSMTTPMMAFCSYFRIVM